jgi:hypothetical protein
MPVLVLPGDKWQIGLRASSLGVVVPIGIMIRHCQSASRVSRTGLVDLICIHASLFPNPSTFLRQEGVRENEIDIMVG